MEDRIFTYPVSPSPCKKISWKKKIQHIIRLFLFYKQITLSEVKGTICKDRKFQELSVIKERRWWGQRPTLNVLACPWYYYVFFQYNQHIHIKTQSQYTYLHLRSKLRGKKLAYRCSMLCCCSYNNRTSSHCKNDC